MNDLARKPLTNEDGLTLRRGWTTGACAAAGAKAALTGLLHKRFPDPVRILLPQGDAPAFGLSEQLMGDGWAEVGIVKDAGDDPDVTHGAMIRTRVTQRPEGSGLSFSAGPGVGTVTLPGLPLAVGEAAINPGPRQQIERAMLDVVEDFGGSLDFDVRVSIPGGEELATQTMNARLGILGGLSILGTTGIVVPYSCSAWIHSIHRGIDVAIASGQKHVAASTGHISEALVKEIYALPDFALIDMGDFAGGTLKYLRSHPIPKLTLAGGFAKIAKLAEGHLDLHSGSSSLDLNFLVAVARELGADPDTCQAILASGTGAAALEISTQRRLPLADAIARRAKETAMATTSGDVDIEVIVVDRKGRLTGRASFTQ